MSALAMIIKTKGDVDDRAIDAVMSKSLSLWNLSTNRKAIVRTAAFLKEWRQNNAASLIFTVGWNDRWWASFGGS